MSEHIYGYRRVGARSACRGGPGRVGGPDDNATRPSYAGHRPPAEVIGHRRHKGVNNRAENSHRPTRRRERQMKCFKSARHAQRFLSAHDGINNLLRLRHHRLPAHRYRVARDQAFQAWDEVTGVVHMA